MDRETKFLSSFSGSRKLFAMKVIIQGAQVVTRGLFLMVVSSQEMMEVAGDGDKQLVICGYGQDLSCQEVWKI